MEERARKVFRIGSRQSQLALIQTELIIRLLKELYPDLSFEVVGMSTKGDQVLDVALSKIGMCRPPRPFGVSSLGTHMG